MNRICELYDIAQQICVEKEFELVRFLDSGAFKETYEVRNNLTRYALKIFSPNNSSERTIREIESMQKLNCPSIAHLDEIGHVDYNGAFYLYILEEFLAGGSLGAYLKTNRLSCQEASAVCRNIIEALNETYYQKLVHRDIKPDNIMFRVPYTDAVLVDFGLVRMLDAESLTHTFQSLGPGTPLYASPEQLNNEKELIDWRSDQFSLAVTICIAIWGKHPFDASTPGLTIERVAKKETCTEEIKELITTSGLTPLLKMLEPYPITRYRLPSDLLEAWNKVEETI